MKEDPATTVVLPNTTVDVVGSCEMEHWMKLVELWELHDWGSNVDHLTAALEIFRRHPTVVFHGIAAKWGKQGEEEEKGMPLRSFLRYHEKLSLGEIQFLLLLRPDALREYDFLHAVCDLAGVRKEVIEFFVKMCPEAVHKMTTIPSEEMDDYGIAKYPLSLYWNRCCRGPEPLEAASSDYWKEVEQVCDLLWIEEKDDFVDPAVEQECWPLVSYFVNKKKPSYWAQEDPEEAWKHNPPTGTLTQGAVDIISKLILPKFRRQACELELPTSSWEDEVLPVWIQNHSDLRLLYLNSRDDGSAWVPARTTDAIFNGLAQNKSLQDFRMSGQFRANWASFANLLNHAPAEVLTCNLLIDGPTDLPQIPSEPCLTSSLRKLDLFRIYVIPESFDLLMQLLTNLPSLEHFELVLEDPNELHDEGLNHQVATTGIINLLEQERLQRLVFGPIPLAVMPMCQLLEHNRTLQNLQCFFQADQPEDYQQLRTTIRDRNPTLTNYSLFEYVTATPRGVDNSMAGFRTDIVFYARFNRIDSSVLGQPEATVNDLLEVLFKAREVVESLDGKDFEERYVFELLQQRPMLWASTAAAVERRGVKRKYVC